jgi:hypothetical protein
MLASFSPMPFIKPPTHLVMYNEMATDVQPFLDIHGYRRTKVFFQNPLEEKYVWLFQIEKQVRGFVIYSL